MLRSPTKHTRRQLRVVEQRHAAPRRRQEAPAAPPETRRERTLRIAPQRLTETVKRLRLCRQLANPLVYDWRGEEPTRFVQVIEDELEALKYELAHPGKAAGPAGIFETEAAD